MKYFLLLLFVLGCTYEVPKKRVIKRNRIVCEKNTISERANFILNCIKNANPKSDEEPEDWIEICKKMAETIYCNKKLIDVTYYKFSSSDYWREQ